MLKCVCLEVCVYVWMRLCAYITLSDRSLCERLWSAMVDDEHVWCKDAALPPLKMPVHFWSCCWNVFSQMVMRPEEVLCHCLHPLKCSGNAWPCKGFSLRRASSWVLPLWHFILSCGQNCRRCYCCFCSTKPINNWFHYLKCWMLSWNNIKYKY